MVSLVNPRILDDSSSFASQFRTNGPFPHIVLDDFFEPTFAAKLLDEFPVFDENRARTELGTIGHKAVNEHLAKLSPNYRRLDDLFQSAAFRELISKVTGIRDLLYDREYFGGGTHDNRHGQELDAHV